MKSLPHRTRQVEWASLSPCFLFFISFSLSLSICLLIFLTDDWSVCPAGQASSALHGIRLWSFGCWYQHPRPRKTHGKIAVRSGQPCGDLDHGFWGIAAVISLKSIDHSIAPLIHIFGSFPLFFFPPSFLLFPLPLSPGATLLKGKHQTSVTLDSLLYSSSCYFLIKS